MKHSFIVNHITPTLMLRRLMLTALLGWLPLLVVGCKPANPATDTSSKPVNNPVLNNPQQPTVDNGAAIVQTIVVGSSAAPAQLLLSAKVEPRVQTPVAFEVSGQVQAVAVNVGDSVAKGTLLASINATDYQLNAAAANDRSQQAKVKWQYLQAESANLKPLVDSGAIARFEYDKMQADAKVAQLQWQEYQKNSSAQQTQVRKAQLYAPHAGVVVSRSMQMGQFVAIGQPVLVLLDPTSLELQLEMPSSVVNELGQWQAMVQLVQQGQLQSKPLTLLRVAALSSGNSSNYTVVYALPPLVTPLKAGEIVAVKLDKMRSSPSGKPNTVALPVTALIKSGASAYVWVVQAATSQGQLTYTVLKQPVTVEAYQTNMVTVTGLTTGARVVTAGVTKLQANQVVQLAATDAVETTAYTTATY